MVSSILKVGTQLDIKVLQQVAQAEKSGEAPRAFRSMIYDIRDNGDLEMGMPLEGGRIVLLPLGVRYELVFSTKRGFYRSVGLVKERYKSDNLYMVVFELVEPLSKFQRREYYRMECLLNIGYYMLTPEEAQMQSDEEILNNLRVKSKLRDSATEDSSLDNLQVKETQAEESSLVDISQEFMDAVAVDVSGGGVRFITEEELEVSGAILIKMPIRSKNGEMEEVIYLRGNILSSKVTENNSKKYEYRVKFDVENERIREELIRFIFKEERKGRNIKKG